MTIRDQAVENALEVGKSIRAIERRLAWGLRQEDASDLTASLLKTSLTLAKALHRLLEATAEAAGQDVGASPEEMGVRSGGTEEKPDPDPKP